MTYIMAFLVGVCSLLVTPYLFSFQQSLFLIFMMWVGGFGLLCLHYIGLVKHLRNHLVLTYSCKLFVCCCLGCLWAHYHAAKAVDNILPEALEGADFKLVGQVISIPEFNEHNGRHSIRFDFRVKQMQLLVKRDTKNPQQAHRQIEIAKNHQQLSNFPSIVRLTAYHTLSVSYGDTWTLIARLKRPRNFANPGGFDYVKYLFAKGIGASGYIRQVDLANKYENIALPWVVRLRAQGVKQLAPLLDDLANKAILQALILGEKSALGYDEERLFRQTGTAHLMAISGLHIGIAAGLGWVLAMLLTRCFPYLLLLLPRNVWAAWLALPVATYYALMSGFSISTQRALIMLLVAVGLLSIRQNLSSGYILLLAAVFVCLIDPLAVLDAGFWFSFTLVFVLVAFAAIKRFQLPYINVTDNFSTTPDSLPPILLWLKKCFRRFAHAAYSLLLIQAVLFIVMPLLVLNYGGELPLVSPLANFLVVPLVSLFVVPLGILSLLVSFVSLELAGSLLIFADFMLSVCKHYLHFVESIPIYLLNRSVIHLPSVSIVVMLVLLGLVAIVSCGRRFLAFKCALGIYIGLIFSNWLFDLLPRQWVVNGESVWQRISRPDIQMGEFSITQLDVGQGTSILVETRRHRLLYDTGPRYSQHLDAANAVILPFLRERKIADIDLAVLGHGDNDHAGGFKTLLQSRKANTWLLGALDGSSLASVQAFNDKADFSVCSTGVEWIWDGVHFEVLHPDIEGGGSNHQNSTLLENFNSNLLFADSRNRNDLSCVLKITALSQGKTDKTDAASALITGDIGVKVERQLIHRYGKQLASKLLVVPHHGSRSSSDKRFIVAVSPELAIISAGFNNRYKHPHPSVVQAYLNRNIAVYNSAQLGGMRFDFKSTGAVVGPYCARYVTEHFWENVDNTALCIGSL